MAGLHKSQERFDLGKIENRAASVPRMFRDRVSATPNTEAPRWANNCATDAPNPDEAPVTRATFPVSCAMCAFRRSERAFYAWTSRSPTALRSPEQL